VEQLSYSLFPREGDNTKRNTKIEKRQNIRMKASELFEKDWAQTIRAGCFIVSGVAERVCKVFFSDVVIEGMSDRRRDG
jgi:hypothetical protein